MNPRLISELKLAQEHTSDFVHGLDIGLAGAKAYLAKHPNSAPSITVVGHELFQADEPYNSSVTELIGTHRYWSRICALMTGCQVGIEYVLSPPAHEPAHE